ncbi:hypothetical protein H8356DRAFT_1675383 [Neocallimastix lanati (nom. inval.)]|nr:hypothetical protein H8356DRAFT_1675383 [Neocallimastix sp. JGI-2020a]
MYEITNTIIETIPISTLLTTSSIIEFTPSPLSIRISTSIITPTSVVSPFLKYLSESNGYACCSSELAAVYTQNVNRDWSYDFNKKE